MSNGGISVGKIIVGVGCGFILAIVVIMGACSMVVGKAALDVNAAMEQEKSKKAAALASIELKDVDSETSSGYVTIRGRACNGGTEPAKFVKIGCDYLSASGQVVNSDFTYASSSDGIQPGACKEFTLMERNSRDWKRYRTYVMTD
ncbi:MAG TPA: hypothetical protein VND45_11240 [Thermoanaerobaculia bacterium]|jgi:hypothetical protein|nr:hypothetical protein [Thermoanaerobaculia bacterium]